MPNLLDPIFLEFILSVVAVSILSFALWREHNKYQKLSQLTVEASFEKTKDKNDNILRRALSRAQTILGQAEDESVEMLSATRATKEKLDEKYQAELVKYFESLRSVGNKSQMENQILLRQKADELFERFEKTLTTFLEATEQKSVTAIDTEVKNMRQTLEEYKRQQLALIDENIISMLEKTLSLVLAKKITLGDQLDLVYEALDKAKAEKFIV